MIKNENKPRLIRLTRVLDEVLEVYPSELKSITPLSPYVSDVRLMNGEIVAVSHTPKEILRLCEEANFPFVKSWRNVADNMSIQDLHSIRKLWNEDCRD